MELRLPVWRPISDITVALPRLWAIGWAFYAFLIFTAIQLGLGVFELYWVTGETLWETEQSRLRVFLAANISCWIIDSIGRWFLTNQNSLALLRVVVVCAVAYLAIWAGAFQLGTDSHVATAGIFSGVVLTLFRSPTAGNIQLLLCLCVTLAALWARGDISIGMSDGTFIDIPLGFALFASFLQPYMIGLIINVSLGRMGTAYEWAVHKQRRLAIDNAKLASTDPLTGARSRAGLQRDFQELLEAAEESGYQLLIAIFDLDNFKHINTFSGHVAGDAVLKHFAKALISALPDAHIYRLGGDEFLALLTVETDKDLPRDQLSQLASEMHVQYLNDDISLTTSVGYCFATPHDTLGQAISRADEAIRQVKRSGKSQAQAYSEDTALPNTGGVPTSTRAITALGSNQASRAISARQVGDAISDGSVGYYLQPIFDSKSKALFGVEALIRWLTPKGTLVPLEDYLPTFTSLEWQSPYLEHLSKIRLALRQQISAQLSVPVHFNFSIEALGIENYAERINGELCSSVMPVTSLVIEVSEKELFSRQAPDYSLREAIKRLSTARSAGAKIALDDFGVELNNFDRLQDLQVDMIKIDQRFIKSLETEKMGQVLVRTMKHLAEDLGIQIIAEGVETQGQKDTLLSLGVDLHQGWLFGKPLPPDELFKSLSSNTS